ncbi:MAG: hypothetical protein U1A78_12590 [Polyangia bacterium]
MAAASLLCATSGSAEAQAFFPRPFVPHFRPFIRPHIMVMPRVVPVVAPPVMVAPPPVYVQPYAQPYPQPYAQPYPQPYPQPYYYAPPPPPPVYVQPAPPPATYVQPLPPPPVYVQPPPVVVQQPAPQVYVQPAPPPPPPMMAAPPPPVVVRMPPPADWKHRFGLGFRFAGAINTDRNHTEFSQLGLGGEILYRAHRRIVMELGGEYQKRVDNGFARWDVPVTLGMRIHIGAPDWVVSPYFVLAAGGAYADLDYVHSHDRAWFLDGQAGGGLEIRLGKRFAISADLRGDARYRLTKPDEATAATLSINGKPFAPMDNQYGLQFRAGAAVYF